MKYASEYVAIVVWMLRVDEWVVHVPEADAKELRLGDKTGARYLMRPLPDLESRPDRLRRRTPTRTHRRTQRPTPR